jgi:CHAT domain-containing protein
LSLWRIADRVKVTLMHSFYEALEAPAAPGSPVLAAALRQATLRTRAEHETSFMWAPFTLFGNPY